MTHDVPDPLTMLVPAATLAELTASPIEMAAPVKPEMVKVVPAEIVPVKEFVEPR